MNPKTPREGSKIDTVEAIKTHDLVYLLEVKLIQSDKDWFINKQMANFSIQYHDPHKKLDFANITEAIKTRIPTMSFEDLTNLKTNLATGPLGLIKEFADEKNAQFARTYQQYKGKGLSNAKIKVAKIIKLQSDIEELFALIEKKSAELSTSTKIAENTQKGAISTLEEPTPVYKNPHQLDLF